MSTDADELARLDALVAALSSRNGVERRAAFEQLRAAALQVWGRTDWMLVRELVEASFLELAPLVATWHADRTLRAAEAIGPVLEALLARELEELPSATERSPSRVLAVLRFALVDVIAVHAPGAFGEGHWAADLDMLGRVRASMRNPPSLLAELERLAGHLAASARAARDPSPRLVVRYAVKRLCDDRVLAAFDSPAAGAAERLRLN